MTDPHKHLKMLQRRLDYLQTRAQTGWALAEMSALSWALMNLGSMVKHEEQILEKQQS